MVYGHQLCSGVFYVDVPCDIRCDLQLMLSTRMVLQFIGVALACCALMYCQYECRYIHHTLLLLSMCYNIILRPDQTSFHFIFSCSLAMGYHSIIVHKSFHFNIIVLLIYLPLSIVNSLKNFIKKYGSILNIR